MTWAGHLGLLVLSGLVGQGQISTPKGFRPTHPNSLAVVPNPRDWGWRGSWRRRCCRSSWWFTSPLGVAMVAVVALYGLQRPPGGAPHAAMVVVPSASSSILLRGPFVSAPSPLMLLCVKSSSARCLVVIFLVTVLFWLGFLGLFRVHTLLFIN